MAGAAQQGGPIQIFVTGSTVTTPILVTGAVTDYGKATSVTKTGKVDENGNFEKVVLQKGGFWIDATALNKKLNGVQPSIDRTHCALVFKGSGPTTVFKGTGAYAGISGSVEVEVEFEFAGIAPRLPSGKRNFGDKAQPVAQYGNVTGSGSVKF